MTDRFRRSKNRKRWSFRVALLLAAFIVIRAFGPGAALVRTTSLEPLLQPGDVVFTARGFDQLSPGDVVTVPAPPEPDGPTRRLIESVTGWVGSRSERVSRDEESGTTDAVEQSGADSSPQATSNDSGTVAERTGPEDLRQPPRVPRLVAAIPGEQVTWSDSVITVRGDTGIRRYSLDPIHGKLSAPIRQARLASDEVFLLALAPGRIDSRVLGPIGIEEISSVVRRIAWPRERRAVLTGESSLYRN
ncbi:MAG: S26 family signal peptidase, partial [Alkalispirochaeta sp.]